MKARILAASCLFNTFACFGAVPQLDVDLDFHAPLNEFTLHIAEGTSPTIRANLFDDGSAFTATGWTGVLYLQASWSASTVIAITNSAVNASSLDFSLTASHTSTTGTWVANFILTETASGDQMEWSRGKVIFRDSPGTSGAQEINLLTALNWDQFTFSGTEPWAADLPVLIAGSGIQIVSDGVNRTISTIGAGTGDMEKADYDNSGTIGIVDNAEALGGTAAASYATDAEVAAAYLPLAGGTLTGDITLDYSGAASRSRKLWFDDNASTYSLHVISGVLSTGADDPLIDLTTSKLSGSALPGIEWTATSTTWVGPFNTGSVDDAGYKAKQISSGGGGFEIAADGIVTSSATQQSRVFVATVHIGGRTTGTQLATSQALELEWVAESATSTTCKADLYVYGNIGDTGENETLVYSATGLTVSTANQREVEKIARASLTDSTLYGQYVFKVILYTKDSSGSFLVRATVNGEAS